MRVFGSLGTILTLEISLMVGGGNAQATSSPSVASLTRQLPSCALNCIVDAVSQSKCPLNDLPCICTTQSITDASQPCILSDCSVRQALETKRLQASTCGLPVRNVSDTISRFQWTTYSLAMFYVLLRFLTKLPCWKGVSLWWDDWTILASVVLLIGSNVLLNRMVNNGLGQDIWMLTPAEITTVQKDYWYSAFLYVICMTSIKVSIVLLYFRTFPPDAVPPWFTWACRAVIVGLVTSAFSLCVANAASCEPVEYNWLQWDGEHTGHCINLQGLAFASAALNILFDLLVFLLPLPLVIPLNISRVRKLGACAVFSIGLFVTIASIIRLRYLTAYRNSTNPTWDTAPLAIWSSAEANFAIVSASLPSLARPIKLAWRKIRHVIGEYSAGSGHTVAADSRPMTAENGLRDVGGVARRDTDGGAETKGLEERRDSGRERQDSGPVPSIDDVELANQPPARVVSY